jgi:N-acetyl-gamma-glutamyl-phosphate reductase
MTAKIFIDGEAGTTGLGIHTRLAGMQGIDILRLADQERKNPDAKRALMREVDLVILCLPDDAAKDSVALADALGQDAPKLLDASTAHRVAPGWVYGFPELLAGQAEAIAAAQRVANPGCYATGAIALLRPLVDAGLIPADFPIAINAVSGYSGGGRAMIEAYERKNAEAKSAPAFELYGLNLDHKHVPEIETYSGLTRRPLFVPSVGRFAQGMLVSVPLFLDQLPNSPRASDLEAALRTRYAASSHVRVIAGDRSGRIEPEGLNGGDDLELSVFADEAKHQAVLVAKLDNLGKGASGAAVQNLCLMLGLDATQSVTRAKTA